MTKRKGKATDLSLFKRLTIQAWVNYGLYTKGSKIKSNWLNNFNKNYDKYKIVGGKVTKSGMKKLGEMKFKKSNFKSMTFIK